MRKSAVISEDIIDAAVEKMTGMAYGLVGDHNVSKHISLGDGSSLAYMNADGARKAVFMVLHAIGDALSDVFPQELWVAYHTDWSAVAVFHTEIEALRHAVGSSMYVHQISAGDVHEQVREAERRERER